jgi:hypothetical protein
MKTACPTFQIQAQYQKDVSKNGGVSSQLLASAVLPPMARSPGMYGISQQVWIQLQRRKKYLSLLRT